MEMDTAQNLEYGQSPGGGATPPGVVSQRIRGTLQNADFGLFGVLRLWHNSVLWHPFQPHSTNSKPLQGGNLHYELEIAITRSYWIMPGNVYHANGSSQLCQL
jgi:hypothetical protein